MDEPRAKQPPHSIEAEQSVLGGLMLSNESWHNLADKLAAEDFYRADHQLIYRAVSTLIAAGKACDFVTLTEHLRHEGRLDEAGGISYLSNLATDTYSVVNLGAYASIIRERALLRGLIAAGSQIADSGLASNGTPPEDLVERAEVAVLALRERSAAGKSVAQLRVAHELVPAWMNQLEARRKAGRAFTGQATGLPDLDRKLAGLQAGRLYVLAARPSIGKTALALNIAQHVAAADQRVCFFSAEMPSDELLDRAVSSWSGVVGDRFRFPASLEENDLAEIARAASHPALSNLWLDDQSGVKPGAIRARARRAGRKATVGMVVIDYLQLLYDERTKAHETRHLEVSRIAASFKALAKELRAPVLLLSQLNRGSEQRSETRPRLSDLRDSGGIEEHADCVLLLHRARLDTGDLDARAELDIAKQRGGPTGRIYLHFEAQLSRFISAADASWLPERAAPRIRGMPDP